ncbi:probable RNA-binding protein 19 [Acanthaster planci]|uniref:Probable RNA-binding protein 19 n=1 Tax=Acanthaster planci TaxID=133434 RepID=A0A8B7Z648_ACAPL|nr:probable RNA-binding protein 19 [Acanthaster planci]
MSRLIVKNLPAGIKEDKIRTIFAAQGEITDLQLKYTSAGVFRKFAFVGFRAKSSAPKAVECLNNTFIDSSKIQVEIAKDLGDSNLARPWSKYSEKSSAFQRRVAKQEEKDTAKKSEEKTKTAIQQGAETKQKKGKVKADPLHELEDDAGFQEFKEAHQVRSKKPLWSNDTAVVEPSAKGQGSKAKGKDRGHDISQSSEGSGDDTSSEENVEMDEVDDEVEGADETNKEANQPVSDMDYLRSKMVKKAAPLDADSDTDSDTDSDADSDTDSEEDSGKDSLSGNEEKPQREKPQVQMQQKPKMKLMKAVNKDDKFDRGQFVLKMRGVPFSVKETDIRAFFSPIAIKAIRIPLNEKKQRTGMAFVEFSSERDLVQSLKRNKDYMGKRYIELFRDEWNQGGQQGTRDCEPPWAKQAAELEVSDEPIGETGRLFVRNLAYVCQEEDLEELFSKYGPLTEMNMPIDPLTKKIKGFAFITFMMPEHAVKAFTDLDGKTFQGRLLHILPGKEKKTSEAEGREGEGSSYKNQKKAKDKARSGSSHNWNSLFIGSDAVAEAIAQKYQTTKSQVLDAETGRSLGVRMALGETQIVAETRQFLLDHGVALDSFSQPSGLRSKTVILVKNLPAGTEALEIRDLFASHGGLGRVVLPPAGVTAIVEFIEPTEARKAFFKLAYTKFHHVPLYLEWAPVNVFKGEPSSESTPDHKQGDRQSEEHTPAASKGSSESDQSATTDKRTEDASDDEEETEPESTIFVKNLNFQTTEDSLRKLFSPCGRLKSVTISRKKDPKHTGSLLSMGYGFVEYKKRKSAQKALKELQHSMLDDHSLELKLSHRATVQANQTSTPKRPGTTKQKSSKILIRNIPFEARKQEIQELFGTFGEIKSVRLPKKMSGTGSHRGFGFVDFLSKQDAKRAFDALCHSSHLYGRRLVLEWAEAEETVEDLRRKTADHFIEGGQKKRLKKSKLKEDLELTKASS